MSFKMLSLVPIFDFAGVDEMNDLTELAIHHADGCRCAPQDSIGDVYHVYHSVFYEKHTRGRSTFGCTVLPALNPRTPLCIHSFLRLWCGTVLLVLHL